MLFFLSFLRIINAQNCQWGDFHFNTPLNQLPQNEILVFGANTTSDVRLIHNIEGNDEYHHCNGIQEATTLNLCIANRLTNGTFKARVALRITARNGNSPFNVGDFEIVNSNIPFTLSLINGGFAMESDEITLGIQSLTPVSITFRYVGANNPNARNEQHAFISDITETIPFATPVLIRNTSLFLQRNMRQVGTNSPLNIATLTDAIARNVIGSNLVTGTKGTNPPKRDNLSFYVNGRFDIDQDLTVKNRAFIYMGPNAEIRVINGASLVLEDSKITTCDGIGDPWSRVQVINGSIRTKSSLDYNAALDNYDEAIVENGQSLVEIQDRGFGSFTDTRFENFNNKAITVNNTGGIGQFYGNKLLSNQAGFAGVELNNTAVALNGGLITSGGSTTTVQTGHNRFEGTNFGIKSNNSQLRARYNDFIEMSSAGVHANSTEVKSISLVKNTFENCPTSMRGNNSNLAFSQNTIHGSDKGIYLTGQNTNVSITNNEDIQVNTVGILFDRLRTGTSNIFHNGIDASIRGIHSHQVLGASMTVDDNNITSGQEGAFIRDLSSPLALWNVRKNSFYSGSKGIYFIAGGGNTVNENKMLSNAIGALVEGGNSYSLTENEMNTCANAMQISASNSPTVACNYSNFSSRGFNFNGNCSKVDFATNLMKGGVGLGVGLDGMINKLQPYKGNLWYNSTANHAGQSPNSFGFTVNEAFNPRHMPTSRNPVGWFDDNQNGTGEDCATFMSEIPKKVGATWAVVNSTYSNPRRGEAGLWIAKAQAYQYLTEHPEDASDELSQAFLAAEAQSSIGKLYAVKQAMSAARVTMLGHINAMEGVNQEISTKMDELEIIDHNLAENPSAAELRTQHIDKVLEIKAKEAIIATKTAELQEDWTANLETALALNAAITVAEEYELNEKSVNSVWLNTIARDLTPSTDELDVLRNVANQCPYSGGEAVYVARGLYQSYVEDATFDDESLCALAQGRIQKENVVSTATLAVYPNPATDMLQILTANNAENATFEVLNTLGQVLYQGASNTIDVSNFQAGLYVCNLLDKGKVVASSKFAIQH